MAQSFDGIPVDNDTILVGLAVSWDNHDAYYISLTSSTLNGNVQRTKVRLFFRKECIFKCKAHPALFAFDLNMNIIYTC